MSAISPSSITGRGRVYKSLQACRAVAALSVVLFHLGPAIADEKYFGLEGFAKPFWFGGAGVEFFFVLSGFIILRAHQQDLFTPRALPAYLKKRFLRIYPTYWIIFGVVLIAALVSPALRSRVPLDPIVLLKGALLIPQDPAVVGGTGAPVIIVAWTLQYEIFFYLFFSLLILSKRLSVVAGIILASLYLVGHLGSPFPFPFAFLSQDYVLLFFLGMAVSRLSDVSRFVMSERRAWAVLAIVGCLLFAMSLGLANGWAGAHLIKLYGGISALLIFAFVVAEDQGIKIGHSRCMQVLGASSYALYLIHYPLISMLCKLAVAANLRSLGVSGGLIAFVLILCTCLAVSVMFHFWIEARLLSSMRNRVSIV